MIAVAAVIAVAWLVWVRPWDRRNRVKRVARWLARRDGVRGLKEVR